MASHSSLHLDPVYHGYHGDTNPHLLQERCCEFKNWKVFFPYHSHLYSIIAT